jgi:hypothetical protein
VSHKTCNFSSTVKAMLVFKMTLISLLVVGTSSQLPTANTQTPCRLWCQLPCIYPWQTPQYYCCDMHVKLGRCPPVRAVCPESNPPFETGSISLHPVVCQSDSQCSGTDKCCYDRCLLHYTCKPAE